MLARDTEKPRGIISQNSQVLFILHFLWKMSYDFCFFDLFSASFFFFFFCTPLNLCDVAPHGFSVSPCSSVRVKQADLRISLCCGPSQIALLHQAVDLWLVDSVNSATTTQSHLYLAVATFKPWQPVIIRRRMLMEANILLYDLCYVCRAFWNLLCTLY